MQKLLLRTISVKTGFVRSEWKLPNERIADVYYVDKGIVHIIEVKTELKDSLIVEAFSKYSKYCDYLYIAAGRQPYIRELGSLEMLCWKRAIDKVGIMLVQWDSITVLRPASVLE